ncbi:MAG: dihydroneopterin aldolase [Pikeienuella sp.]
MNEQSSVLDTVDGAIPVTGSATPDRIFLRDHIRNVEIGCYEEEFGVTQALRFNVVLDVPRFTPEAADEEAAIVSYDLIVDAVEALISGQRISLVETFAERLAARLLADSRVSRAWIRIEKLDRVSGSLGVEIIRS